MHGIQVICRNSDSHSSSMCSSMVKRCWHVSYDPADPGRPSSHPYHTWQKFPFRSTIYNMHERNEFFLPCIRTMLFSFWYRSPQHPHHAPSRWSLTAAHSCQKDWNSASPQLTVSSSERKRLVRPTSRGGGVQKSLLQVFRNATVECRKLVVGSNLKFPARWFAALVIASERRHRGKRIVKLQLCLKVLFYEAVNVAMMSISNSTSCEVVRSELCGQARMIVLIKLG